VDHIDKTPVLTKGVGLLKMAMPKAMAETIKEFWDEHGVTSRQVHEPIGG
jgi:hypothetical protein